MEIDRDIHRAGGGWRGLSNCDVGLSSKMFFAAAVLPDIKDCASCIKTKQLGRM